MRTKLAALVVGSTFLSTGCVMLETEIPHVCVQEQDVVLEVPVEDLEAEALEALGLTQGDPVVVDSTLAQQITAEELGILPTISLQESFTPEGLDSIPSTLDDLGADGVLRLLDVTIGGTADMFAGIERVAVSLAPGSEGESFEPVTLATCDVQQGCDITSDQLELNVNTQDDLLSLLQHEGAQLVIDLVARPTVSAYELDVDVCMAAAASIKLSI